MSIKLDDRNISFIRGRRFIGQIMVGERCVYGEGLQICVFSYSSVMLGMGYSLEVNGKLLIENPLAAGEFKVFTGDEIYIRTYGLPGYQIPSVTLSNGSELVEGNNCNIVCGALNIARACEYRFVVKGDCSFTVDECDEAPKSKIIVDIGDGVEYLSLNYKKSPYCYSGQEAISLETVEGYWTSSCNEMVYEGTEILTTNYTYSIKEGYKKLYAERTFTGVLTSTRTCTVRVATQAGTPAVVVCPAVLEGVAEYGLYMVSSEYSRYINTEEAIYSAAYQSSIAEDTTLVKRNQNGSSYYLYVGDVIRVVASRQTGYKQPNLGKSNGVEVGVTDATVTLEQSTSLVVEAGEKGIEVILVNAALGGGEYVYLNVHSDYAEPSIRQRNPQIYVGDKVDIPADATYRIGSKQHRRPGVGVATDAGELITPTFNVDLNFTVPTTETLTLVLLQGANRVVTSAYVDVFSPLFSFKKKGTETFSGDAETGLLTESIEPETGLGAEGYYISTIMMRYSCKRYLGDAIHTKFVKYEQTNVPNSFAYNHTITTGTTHEALNGTWSLTQNGTTVTMTLTRYNDNVVADIYDSVKVYPYNIII